MYPNDPNQPPAPPPYGGQQYGAPAPYAQSSSTNTMAIVALIGAFVFAPLGIVFGHIARGQINRTGEGGRGLATAGLILGYVFTAIWLLTVVLMIVFGVFVATHEQDYSPSYTPSTDTSVFFSTIP